jgi:hypothetical protein
MDYSDKKLAERVEKTAGEVAYFDDLKRSVTEAGHFRPMEINDTDDTTIKNIKKKINHIVAEELAKIDFKDQVNAEALIASTTDAVMTR